MVKYSFTGAYQTLSVEGLVAKGQETIPMESRGTPDFTRPSKSKDIPSIYTLPSHHTIMEGKSEGYWNMATDI